MMLIIGIPNATVFVAAHITIATESARSNPNTGTKDTPNATPEKNMNSARSRKTTEMME
ncbi:hypothetical protein HK102_011415, partial [Quaeritorhiza haematococci]